MKDTIRSLLLQAAARRVATIPQPNTPPQSILLIRPDHLGDVLFLTPALRALRAAQPQARITLLVGPWAEGLLTLNPDVDQVETLRFPWFDRQPKRGLLAPYRQLQQAATALRGRFDVAVICRFDHWWGAWLAAEAAIPRRLGYKVPDVAPFLTERVPYQPGQHEAIQNLRLLQHLGTPPTASPVALPLRYEITGADRLKARQPLNESGLRRADGPLVAIHPGSGAAVKRWDVALWGRLMDELHTRHGAQFVITGGASEVLLASKVVRAASPGTPVASLADQTTLPTLAALFEQCALVIGPDSGPLHLAVAMQRPTLHLYGPVDPATFGPWGDPARHVAVSQSLACQFCNRLDWPEEALPEHPCTTHLPFPLVADAASRLLGTGF